MKTLLIYLLLFIASPGKGITQPAPDSSKDLAPLLTKYYAIKNALVSGDAVNASLRAAEFSSILSTVDIKKLSATEQSSFANYETSLTADAKKIAATKDINKQREAFSSFSTNMISLAKAVRISAEPIYVDYCPMKKAYWLSAEQPISNPYYGSSMLRCGSVKDTIR